MHCCSEKKKKMKDPNNINAPYNYKTLSRRWFYFVKTCVHVNIEPCIFRCF